MKIYGYRCPNCRKELFGDGKFGESAICECGTPLPAKLLDKARRHWIFQCALPYSIATFLIILVFSQQSLSTSPWERLFSPVLLAPSIASFIVISRILSKHKNSSDTDDLLFRYYTLGMCLMAISLLAALISQMVEINQPPPAIPP